MLMKADYATLYGKNGKFWFKLIAGLFTIAIFLAVFINGIIDVQNIGKEIETGFQGLSKQTRLEDFMQQFQDKFAGKFRIDGISVIPVIETNSDNIDIVKDLWISAGFGEYTFFFVSFFTNVSNLLVGIWFLVAAIRPQKEGRGYYIGYTGTMIVTTYITLTMIIFTSMLVPVSLVGGFKITGEVVLVAGFQHLVFPLLLIVYVCLFFNPRATMSNKRFMRREGGKMVFGLLVYLAGTLIRGEIRYRGKRPLGTLYPYFFMDLHNPQVMGMPGYAGLILVVFIIIGLIFGISILLNGIVTKRVRRQRRMKKW